MIIDLFDNYQPRWFPKLIQHLREQHKNEGGDPIGFPDYLAKSGFVTIGQVTRVPDELAAFAVMKWS